MGILAHTDIRDRIKAINIAHLMNFDLVNEWISLKAVYEK
jgi:hypothetical protein